MILVDSNIPMYLVGSDHPNKANAQRIIERALTDRDRLVTDAEVLQEILHRYTAINRPDAIQPAFDLLLSVVDEVFSISATEVESAKNTILGNTRLSARDAVHLAVMKQNGIERIMSFDAGFDGLTGIHRIHS